MTHQPLNVKQRQMLYRALVMMLAGVPKAERMARHEAAKASYRARKARKVDRQAYR
ncbi:hypothetical protein [Pseudomonas monteilii]|uniref:hypothetical protein n=1 Tax=Pseudomonas monteilii TaxID=76759 RepID=UPI001788BEA6|nr:hypothetical protein [Pseudomonas monteilii]